MSRTGQKTTVNLITNATQPNFTAPKVLLIGLKESEGTAQENELVENIKAKGIAWNKFGRNSHICQMVGQFLDIANASRYLAQYAVKLDAFGIPDADAGGTASTATITFTGAATSTGYLTFRVGDSKFEFSLKIISGQAGADIATNLVTLINSSAYSLDMPFTVAAAEGVVTFTSTFNTILANDLILEVIGLVDGVKFALTGFSGGAGTFSLGNLENVIQSKKYDYIYLHYAFLQQNPDFINTIENKFNVENDDLAGLLFTACVIDYETALTTFDQNKRTFVPAYYIPANLSNVQGNYLGSFPCMEMSKIIAQRALSRTPGAYVGDFIINSEATRSQGTPHYSAVSLSEMPILNSGLRENRTNGLNDDQMETLLDTCGGLMIEVDANTGRKVIGAQLTSYKTDAAGEPVSFNRISYFDTIFTIRTFMRQYLISKWSNRVMTDGSIVQGTLLINKRDAIADIIIAIKILAGVDPVTNITYGLIPNNSELIQDIQNKVTETMDFNFPSGRITADAIYNINKALEETIFNNIIL